MSSKIHRGQGAAILKDESFFWLYSTAGAFSAGAFLTAGALTAGALTTGESSVQSRTGSGVLSPRSAPLLPVGPSSVTESARACSYYAS